ncbi:protein of unknown function [Streptomyces sp. KY75]|nr:protein of unknown function [Streptomyces sp. KY70]CAD5987489.1 protein of unknown function [Streptomyces sp. KY75]
MWSGHHPPPGARSTFPTPGPSLLRQDTAIHPIGRALGVNTGGAGGAFPVRALLEITGGLPSDHGQWGPVDAGENL